jgi:two-component system sensor histidine kinase/response regulator
MKKLLLVDDEEDLINIIGQVLEELGYDIQKSVNAEEAMQVCSGNPPDLIICDVKMPAIDGFELLEKLKTRENLRSIPFVFLTAFDDPEGRKRGMRLGADAYVTKPFDVDDLVKLVQDLAPI